jgi:acylphosphatase
MMRTVRIRIEGRVQGVSFRDWMQGEPAASASAAGCATAATTASRR